MKKVDIKLHSHITKSTSVQDLEGYKLSILVPEISDFRNAFSELEENSAIYWPWYIEDRSAKAEPPCCLLSLKALNVAPRALKQLLDQL